jgi:hypothetical protein
MFSMVKSRSADDSGDSLELRDGYGMKWIWKLMLKNLFKLTIIIVVIMTIVTLFLWKTRSITGSANSQLKRDSSAIKTKPTKLAAFIPCYEKSSTSIGHRELHVLTCDDFGKGRFLALNDAINTWNITSQNLWSNGVIMKNICDGRSLDHSSLTKSIAYLEYTSSLLDDVRRMNLSRIDKLHVMLMDSNTFWSADNIQQIWDRYDCARGDKEILVSSEMGYHGNSSHITRLYGKTVQAPTYSSFVNSGVIMGKAIFIEEMLRFIVAHNQSYYSHHDHDGLHDQHAISDFALRVAPGLVAIDYHQQLTGSFAVHASSRRLPSKHVSLTVCRAKNGAVDCHCQDMTIRITTLFPTYFHFNESSCSIYRDLQANMQAYQQLGNLASHPVIWQGNEEKRRTYVTLSNQAVNCWLKSSNSTNADNATHYSTCPCLSDSRSNTETHPISYEICIINSSIAHDFLLANQKQLITLNISLVSETSWKSKDVSRCLAVIDLLPPQPIQSSCSYKYICPEACLPRPYTAIPINWLTDRLIYASSSNTHIPITCSLTVGQLVRGNGTESNISTILSTIAMRRMQECVEREYWLRPSDSANGRSNLYLEPIDNTTYNINRRDVFGLMIWIGSINRLDMSIAQSRMLHDQWQRPAGDVIAGWIASEEQYSCRVGSGFCHRSHSNYSHLYWKSFMNREPFGWQCAQRRPLRALAHVLWLYNPEFVYLLDDDTFVNIPRFFIPDSPLFKYIRSQMKENPYVVGRLEDPKGRSITISKHGMIFGGEGYLMGRAVLDRLQSYTIYGPTQQEDKYRSIEQMKYLSILRAAYEQLHQCPSSPYMPCLTLQGSEQLQDYKAVATSAVRLVDLCVSLMSKEHTCFHSDQAMTHCLVHGAYVDLIRIDLMSNRSQEDREFSLALGVPVDEDVVELQKWWETKPCNLSRSLTCHHYVYNRTDLSDLQTAAVLGESSAHPRASDGC